MSETPDDVAAEPRDTYQVIHRIFAPGEFSMSEQISSAAHTAEEAIAWIRQHVAGSRSPALGLAETGQETQTPAGQGNDQAGAPEAVSVAPDAAATDGPVAS